MNEVMQAAAQLQAVCQSQGWRFCFIGGIALLRWGKPRETIDADITLMVGYGAERPYIQTLLSHFQPRVPDPGEFAMRHRVLLLRAPSGVGLDISLGALQYEESMVARSSEFRYSPDVTLRTCSAEDLVIMKTFAGRTQDWADVENILTRQKTGLDWTYIEEQLKPLVAISDDASTLARLAELRSRLAH